MTCTDNAPFYKSGFEVAMLFEGGNGDEFPDNDKVGPNGEFLDTVDRLDFDHIGKFVKSTLGFVVELSLAPSS